MESGRKINQISYSNETAKNSSEPDLTNKVSRFTEKFTPVALQYVITQELADYYTNTGKLRDPNLLEMIRKRKAQIQEQWAVAYRSIDPSQLTEFLINRARQKAAPEPK